MIRRSSALAMAVTRVMPAERAGDHEQRATGREAHHVAQVHGLRGVGGTPRRRRPPLARP
jgi:hypothetical protein